MLDVDEPFTNLLCQGMVKDANGETMSKSKGNVVPPSSVIEPYGADTMPLVDPLHRPAGEGFRLGTRMPVAGANRFIKRAWRIVWQLANAGDASARLIPGSLDAAAKQLYRERHRTLAKCTEDFDRQQFNTAISAIMELVNAASAYLNATDAAPEARRRRSLPARRDGYRELARADLPVLGGRALARGARPHRERPTLRRGRSSTSPRQRATRSRSLFRCSESCAPASKSRLRRRRTRCASAAEAAAAKWIEGKTVVKAICIPGKLVNLVVK